MLLLAFAALLVAPAWGSLPLWEPTDTPRVVSQASQAIRAAGRAIVRSCATSMRARQVTRASSTEETKKLGIVAWDEFTIYAPTYPPSPGGNELSIDKPLYFHLPESLSGLRATEIRANTQACLRSVETTWQRYGIALRISDRWLNDRQAVARAGVIEIHDAEDRSNKREFFYRSHRNAYLPSDSRVANDPANAGYCLMVLHEVAHHFALPDEYREAGVTRDFYATERYPTSVLANPYVGAEATELLPRHIRTILFPACPELSAQPGAKTRLTVTRTINLPWSTRNPYVRFVSGRIDTYDQRDPEPRRPYCEMVVKLERESDEMPPLSVDLVLPPLQYWQKPPKLVGLLTPTAIQGDDGTRRTGRYPRVETFRCEGVAYNLNAIRAMLGAGVQLRN